MQDAFCRLLQAEVGGLGDEELRRYVFRIGSNLLADRWRRASMEASWLDRLRGTTDTHIDIIETGRYEVVLETGKCVADVKRTRTYDIVADDKPAPASVPSPAGKEPPPKAQPKPSACESPGEPTRLEVRPSKKLLRTGETFQFRAIVLDVFLCTRFPSPIGHDHCGSRAPCSARARSGSYPSSSSPWDVRSRRKRRRPTTETSTIRS